MGGGGGKGGGYDAPEIQPTPKAQVTKPVTEAATAARQDQKDKASKAAGLRGSILTSDLVDSTSGNGGTVKKTLLGE